MSGFQAKMIIWGASILVLVSACADNRRESPEIAARTAADGLEIGRLPPQTLERGNCGLFLWSKTTPPELVFFHNAAEGGARLKMNGEDILVPKTAQSGVAVYGQNSSQSFKAENFDLELKIAFDESKRIVNGTRVPLGTLKILKADGWTSVLPVAGMIACEPS